MVGRDEMSKMDEIKNLKKLKIIRTAMKLFVEQGFENTPTAQIAREAQVANGTLFYHYKTKEDLINEIYLYVKKSMKDSIFENINLSDNFEKIMKNIWKDMISWGFENKMENLFLVKFHGSVYISKLTLEELREDFKKGEEIFKKGFESGEFKKISPELFQNITMNLLQSFLTEFYRIGRLDSELLEKSFQIYWDAIKK